MSEKVTSGAVGRRAKFQALRAFVEAILDEKLDMRYAFPRESGCGCIRYHAYDQTEFLEPILNGAEWKNTFDTNGAYGASSYPEPKGQPAKAEFLRRLAALEEKYCAPVAQATNSASVITDPEAHSNA